MSNFKSLAFIGLALVLLGGGCAGATDGSTADGGSKGLASGTGVITIDSPVAGETIDRPVKVTGSATTPDGEVYLRLTDQDGEVMVESHTNVDASGSNVEDFYNFNAVFYFAGPSSATLELYWVDEDGNETDTIEIPVLIQQ